MSLYASMCGHFLEAASPWNPYDQDDFSRPFCPNCLVWMKDNARTNGVMDCTALFNKLNLAPRRQKERSDDTTMREPRSSTSEMSGIEPHKQERLSDLSMTEGIDEISSITSPTSMSASDKQDWTWFRQREATAVKAKVDMDELKRFELRQNIMNQKRHSNPVLVRDQSSHDTGAALKIVRKRISTQLKKSLSLEGLSKIQARHRRKPTVVETKKQNPNGTLRRIRASSGKVESFG